MAGRENTEDHIKGTKADILVNDFQSAPCRTWRAAAIAKNNCNIAEVGWISMESHGYQAAPYKTTFGADAMCGYYHAEYWSQLLSRGVNHNFKVHDDNDDQYWSFAVDGSALPGGNKFVPFNNGLSVTTSERDNAGDILFARVRNLQKCPNAGACWFSYGGLSEYGTPPSDYDFCWLSKTSYNVQGTC